MDFLDPLKRRRRRTRLMFSYVLMATAIIGGTILLVLVAGGYGINPRTGDIIHNGLVFVESKPGGAGIYLNGERRGQTSARLVLPAKRYKMQLKREGYLTWQRNFQLSQQAVLHLDYALLLPKRPKVVTLKTYQRQPSIFSLSPDHQRLVVGGTVSGKAKANLDIYQANNPSAPPQRITLDSSELSVPGRSGGQLVAIEWSSNSRHLLVRHDAGKLREYIVVDVDDPRRSLNLNNHFKLEPSSVSLRDGKANQFYIYRSDARSLSVALSDQRALAKPFLKNVKSFRVLGDNQIFYISSRSAQAGKIDAKIWDSGLSYRLASLSKQGHKQIAAGRYGNDWYYAIASDSGSWLNIYKNPLNSLRKPKAANPDAFISLKIKQPQVVRFSPEQHFILAQSEKSAVVYDLEAGDDYAFELPAKLTGHLHWLDEFRISALVSGKLWISDFDGSNQQRLAESHSKNGGFLAENQQRLFVINNSKSERFSLQALDLRAGDDLPKN